MEARLDALPTSMSLTVGISIPATKLSPKLTTKESKPKRVFIVHGRDNGMKHAVARIIEKLGLEAIILDEMITSGKAIVEKLDHYSDVDYAVILFSPDDMGYLKQDGPEKAKSRARQNVILELGLFMGMEKIKRNRIAIIYLVTDNFDFPSDFEGIVYIPFDQHESWKYTLAAELRVAGFDVDANKLLNHS